MRPMLIVCALALITGPAYADCTPPDAAVTIPDGAAASRDQMIAAQHAVKALDTAVKAYADCLQEQIDRTSSDVDKERLTAQYVKMNNSEVDKLQKLAEKFNTELRVFKAKSTG